MQAAVVQPSRQPILLQDQEGAPTGWDRVCTGQGTWVGLCGGSSPPKAETIHSWHGCKCRGPASMCRGWYPGLESSHDPHASALLFVTWSLWSAWGSLVT